MKKNKKTIIGLILGLFLSFIIILTHRVEAKADTITDLTGYTWVGNNVITTAPDGWSFSDPDANAADYWLNFVCNNINFSYFNVKDADYSLVGISYGVSLPSNVTQVYKGDQNIWVQQVYKTIQITGGVDATNSTLIAWLQANGTLTAPVSTYTITFNANGGSGTAPASVSVNAGDNYTIPGNTTGLTKTNYHFVGWNTNSSATTGLASLSNIQADTILYAIWAIDQYTLILNGNGAQFLIISSQTYENAISGTATAGSFYSELESLLQLATISRAGYTLLGWNTNSLATTALSQAQINSLSGNTTLYAIWARNCIVTFYGNGATSGTPPANIEVTEGTTITLPGNTGGLARSGYNFLGWSGDPYSTTTTTTATIINVDTRFYAIWEPINRYMNLTIKVNNINVYTAELFKETGNFYDLIFEVDENSLLGISFFNINYLRDPEADSDYILMSYADRLVLSMLTNDITSIGIYQNGYLVESGTIEQWRDYFSTQGRFEMGFFDRGDITISITADNTGNLGSFKAIVATAVTAFQVLFDLRLGWITIGGIISIVLTIGVVFFIFKVVKGGGN